MTEILNEPILDYCFITSAFYNFVINSGKNFQKIDLTKSEESIIKQFEEINQENYFDYIENQSYINNNDEQIKKLKLKTIQKFFKYKVNLNEKEKLFNEINKKMNISIFVNKNILIKLLSQQIINFMFEINELFFLIIKSIEKNHNEIIEKVTVDNLINEDKIKKEKTNNEIKLLKENKNLMKKIESLNNSINNNNEKNLIKKNKDLENQINELKEKINNYEINIKKQKEIDINKFKKNLKIEKIFDDFSINSEKSDKYKKTVTDLIKQNKDLDLKVFDLNSEVLELKKENKNLQVKVSKLSEENKNIFLKISELSKENKNSDNNTSQL